MPTLIEDLQSICAEMFARWDADMKAGKLLSALEGRISNYDPRVTRVREALLQYERRIAELLEANVRFEARARAAEAERDEARDEGANFVLDALCSTFNVEVNYDAATETWDGDVKSVLRRILHAAKLIDEETGEHAPARIERAEAERDEARAALEPFAKAADNFDFPTQRDADTWSIYRGISENGGPFIGAITVGDLRRARAAAKGGGDGE